MTAAPYDRTLLIGLDGATYSVLDPLMANGTMPFLAAFTAGGVRAVLQSTAHPLTPPAWTTLVTGRTPGNHGVFDFVRVDGNADPPGYTLVTSADNGCETIWSIADRHGRRVTTLNFPCMFPPPALNGFVIPGFVPRSYLPRAVHPRELYARLKQNAGFNARELAIDWETERKALQGVGDEEVDDWIAFHSARERQWHEIALMLMREEPCELIAVLFDGTDKLQHLCYHLLDPKLSVHHDSEASERARALCLAYFRQLDGFIADLVHAAGADARVFCVSDHGFTNAGNTIFYANVWLEQHGYLAWSAGVPLDELGRLNPEGFTETETLLDWRRTVAFSMTASSNGIYIRRAASPQEPGVQPAEYIAFRRKLADALLAFRDPGTGDPVVEAVLLREEAFPGSRAAHAPDLTLRLRDRGFLSVLRADQPVMPRRAPYGTHHPDGILIGRGPGLREGVDLGLASIVSVAPTVLFSLGLPLRDDLEAAPLLAAFTADFVTEHPVTTERGPLAGQTSEGTAPAPGDAEMERQVLEGLKALGYIE